MTPNHLKKLKREGKIQDFKEVKKEKKACKYKSFIQAALEDYCVEKGLVLMPEHQFARPRKWKFDWAMCPNVVGAGNTYHPQIAVEYEGIFSAKSRHTSLKGFQGDVEKYNTAALMGWTVLRYTAKNFRDIIKDLEKL